MDELIARLEAASDGSRELDWEIRQAMGSVRIPLPIDDRCWAGRAVSGAIYQAAPRGGSTRDFYLPFYTTSLDAALTLVPEHSNGKWPWAVTYPAYKKEGQAGGFGRFKYMDGKTYAGIRNPLSSHLRGDYEAYGKTPALALCIAALAARKVMD